MPPSIDIALGVKKPVESATPSPEAESDGHQVDAVHQVDSAHIDPQEEARLRRKLDAYILPIFTLGYLLMFLDRSNIGNARATGLVEDLHLHKYDFNAGSSLYWVAYLATDVFSSLLIKRYGLILVPLSVIAFGFVTFIQAWIVDRTGFYLTRVALGISESFLMPGISYLLTRYYRRSELTFRYGCFMVIAAGLAGSFGGLLAAGLLSVGKIGDRVGWRNIFLVEGIITMGLGAVLVLVFPDHPETTRYLNPRERELAIQRILIDQPQIKETKEKIDRHLVRRGILNLNTMGTILVYCGSSLTVQGLGVFLPSILKINYPGATNVRIQLLTAPIYAVAMVLTLFVTYLCVRLCVHWWFAAGAGGLAAIGYGIWAFTGSSDGKLRYAACFINMTAGFILGPVALGWSASNASPDTIRAMVGAVVTGFGAIAAIAGIWAYHPTTAADGYRPGNIFNLGYGLFVVVCSVGLMLYQRWENREREKGHRDYRLDEGKTEKLGNHHPDYRYIH